jgi:hypothetical protein
VSGLAVPLWVFAVGYALADAVLVQRLVLYYRAQRAERAERRPVVDDDLGCNT